MYHSRKTTCVLMIAVALLTGCSQRDDITAVDDGVGEKNAATVVFRLQTNGLSAMSTRGAEDSYNHVQGTPDEYQVNNARVYLFDALTKLFLKSVQLKNLTRAGSDAAGNIVYEAEHVSVPQGTYDIFVTANTDRQINADNEDEFLADIDSISYVRGQIDDITGGVVMTNRASENTGVVIVNNPNNADNVISVTLERVLARLDIAKASETFELTDDKGQLYASVTLDGYYIVNLAKYYYSYRHTAVLTNLTEPVWNIGEHFGNVNDVNGYVIDPDFFKKSINAAEFTNSDKYYEHFFGDYSDPKAVQWTAFKPVGNTPQYNTTYCLENCALAQAQKNGYSTGVIFRAKLEPANNVYHLADNGTLELITDKSRYPEVLYYFNHNFYDSAAALAAAIDVPMVTGNEIEMNQVQKFEKGDDGYRCYYNYWIRHLDNYKATLMGVMEFGIVRNNLYRMMITNVSGLGYSEVEQVIAPDTPDEGETYLKAVLNVKPWIVRDLTNIVL